MRSYHEVGETPKSCGETPHTYDGVCGSCSFESRATPGAHVEAGVEAAALHAVGLLRHLLGLMQHEDAVEERRHLLRQHVDELRDDERVPAARAERERRAAEGSPPQLLTPSTLFSLVRGAETRW